ncbi:ABC transporter ATP-binding protein [Helicobacter jaachi]|uniref:ABC transporter ATP-binding protein n=1 Tax=Helicobacter jaachi TaxID=1677920 RepID=A0A4U8T8U6_9HELI|nr:ABC transporter ATP-binding protein [Helicobacter jaachi]TLD96075.1 ABC transporter ATP-binding protein [Helicobacter jaachi]
MSKTKLPSTFMMLRHLTTRRDKVILLMLFIATIILSIIETIGVSVIMPFITFASNPQMIFAHWSSAWVYEKLHFANTLHFMYAFSGLLLVFYLFRAVYNALYNYALSRFAFGKFHFFAYRLFCKSVELSYLDFTTKKTDKLRQAIITEAQNTSFYLQNLLQIAAELFTITLMYALLLVVSWKMTLALTLLLGIQVALILKFLSSKIKNTGEIDVEMSAKLNEILTKTFGNFKFIKLKGNQKQVYDAFNHISRKRVNATILTQTLMPMPRIILETIGFSVLIGCVAYILFRYEDASAVIPIISMYALALYRILPAVTRILNNINMMSYLAYAVKKVYENLIYHTDYEDNEPCVFEDCITLQNVDFAYTANKPILRNFSLTIKKGEKVAFVGESGAGKSTLVDIIIGIYKPQKGQLLVDNVPITNHNLRSWRKKIGYIPQSIYLFDGSVAENVAFGSVLDEQRVRDACKKACILDFLEQHNGIHTRVGEGGILLSGGQKQRIGIARAIYDEPEILVLDEATSALDNQTESNIMDAIYDVAAQKTLLIIAHRLSTIERCQRRIELEVPHKTKRSKA